jgi:hypothetical protein
MKKPAGPIQTKELSLMSGDITKVISVRRPGWFRHNSPCILAVDPGKDTAWCRIPPSGGDVTFRAFTASALDCAWHNEAHTALAVAATQKPALLVIEGSFVKLNIRTAIVLAQHVGAWVSTASSLMIPTWIVQPSEWQHDMIGTTSREAGKKMSVAVAKQRVSSKVTSHHEADACLMALWARGGLL